MKKVIPIVLIFAVAVTALLFIGRTVFTVKSDERIERITGYDLPDDMEELYHFQEETFSGVGSQYSVYSLDEEPQFIKENPIDNRVFTMSTGETTLLYQSPESSDKSPFALTESEEASIIRNLEIFDIPEEYIPDFEKPYTYTTGKENTYIIYFSEENKLVVWMRGH